jgi:hypothetical protein
MTNLKLSTNLIGVDGTYCTYWGLGKDLIDSYRIDEDFKEGYIDYNSEYFWGHYNHSAFMDDWAKQVYNFIDDIIVDIFKCEIGLDVSLEYCGRWSPREYNFSHDTVNFDLNCEQGFSKLVDFCTNHPDFSKFLKDNFSSYDGFMSFTANNIEQLLEDVAAEDMTAYGAMMCFMLTNFTDEDLNNIEFEIYYNNYFDDGGTLDTVIEELESGDTETLEWGMCGADKEMKDVLLERYLSLDKYEVIDLYNLDFDVAANILQERYPNLEYEIITKHMLKYWGDVDNKTADLFTNN